MFQATEDSAQENSLVAYDPSKDSNYLSSLLSEYSAIKEEIIAMARASRANNGALEYFYRALENSFRFKDMFNEEEAIKALNSEFWGRIIQATDVLQCMPAADRCKWNDMVRERKTPEFTKDNVKNTISTLLMQRPKFLAQKVDGIFFKLSGKHVTNDPIGFGQRMIFERILNCYGDASSQNTEYIDDLRHVIGKLVNRDFSSNYRHSYYDITAIKSESGFGKWYRLDGGALKIKLFKKGTLHISVHPDIAYLLNGILAELNPAVISSSSKSKVKFSPDFDKNDVLMNDVFSAKVVDAVRSVRDKLDRGNDYYMSSEMDKATKKDLTAILEFLGGIEDKSSWTFDYDVRPILSEIARVGAIPEKKSHQFYPTKPELAQRLVTAAAITAKDKVLEPSAGHGGIATFIKSKNLTCVEISKTNCKVLEQKGFSVIEHNFLTWNSDIRFNKIVMNPPFHFRQAADHVRKAFDLLATGGEIHAILPSSYAGEEFFNKWDCKCEYSEVIDSAFDGTEVSVVLLKLTSLR